MLSTLLDPSILGVRLLPEPLICVDSVDVWAEFPCLTWSLYNSCWWTFWVELFGKEAKGALRESQTTERGCRIMDTVWRHWTPGGDRRDMNMKEKKPFPHCCPEMPIPILWIPHPSVSKSLKLIFISTGTIEDPLTKCYQKILVGVSICEQQLGWRVEWVFSGLIGGWAGESALSVLPGAGLTARQWWSLEITNRETVIIFLDLWATTPRRGDIQGSNITQLEGSTSWFSVTV